MAVWMVIPPNAASSRLSPFSTVVIHTGLSLLLDDVAPLSPLPLTCAASSSRQDWRGASSTHCGLLERWMVVTAPRTDAGVFGRAREDQRLRRLKSGRRVGIEAAMMPTLGSMEDHMAVSLDPSDQHAMNMSRERLILTWST